MAPVSRRRLSRPRHRPESPQNGQASPDTCPGRARLSGSAPPNAPHRPRRQPTSSIQSAERGPYKFSGLVFAYGLLQSGVIPANADAKPGGLELWAASTSLNATLRRAAPKGPNPVALSDANLVEGVKLYAQHCAMPWNRARRGLRVAGRQGALSRPPQLANEGVEDDPEGASYWRIKRGVRLIGMPSWGATLTDQQIWTLALFLKHMDKLPPGPQAAWIQVRN